MPKYSSVERSQYGTSPIQPDRTASVDTTIVHPALTAAVNTAKGKKRRDSAAPLMSAPPIHNTTSTNKGFNPSIGSSYSNPFPEQVLRNGSPKIPYLEDALPATNIVTNPTTHTRYRSGLHRRRRCGTTIEEGGSEDESKGESSDENDDSDIDNDDSSESGLSSDDDEEQIARQINGAKDAIIKSNGLSHFAQVDLSNVGLDLPSVEGQQRLLLLEEDMELLIEAYRFEKSRLYLYRLSCILSLGMVWLLCRWMPHLWIKWVGTVSPMSKAEWFAITVSTPEGGHSSSVIEAF